jgi:hypothetical protein
MFIGDDKLDPATRLWTSFTKWRWRRSHHVAPRAMPVFIVGLQRSGTNMLVRAFETLPEFEVHNEDDPEAFDRFRLRDDETVRALVERSGHPYVLFKPLCDSHRVTDLLDGLRTPTHGRAVWIYRSVEGRARSAVATFGDANVRVLRAIAEGRGAHRWQAQGLSERSMNLIRGQDYDRMSPEAAAVLFWCVRNSLYFEHGLHERNDVTLVSYDAFLHDPDATIRSMCAFLEFPYTPSLVAHIEPRPARTGEPIQLAPDIARLSEELTARLDEAARQKAETHHD